MHTIRLCHPWKSESQGGMVHWSRRFNWPADNGAHDTIFLAVRPWQDKAQVVLNDQPLDVGGSASRCDVTTLLCEFNRLQINIPVESCTDGQFPLEVQLEIEEGL